jgi:hypothetical protein
MEKEISRGMFRSRKIERQDEAIERQTFRDNLTNENQIQVLDRRLGKGEGAVKERARLLKKIEKADGSS